MTQFYQVFFEETAEHLSGMESMLLELDVQQPDAEQLNAIFRAAHSIKGSSGTFGFTDLAEVTHVLENLLDRIRKGELTLRENMIDAFLDAGDILKTLLAAHRGEAAADPTAVAAICTRLRQLTSDDSPPAVSEPAATAPAVVASPAPMPNGTMSGLEISFVIDESTEDSDKAIENLLAELGSFGQASILERPAAAGQPWRLNLLPSAGRPDGAAELPDEDTLRDMLDFVARSDSIRISRLGAAQAAGPQETAYGFFDSPTLAASAPAEEGYGFFEPQPVASAGPQTAPVAAATGSVGADGDGYGFFSDLPAQVPAEVAAPATVAPAPDAAPRPAARWRWSAERRRKQRTRRSASA